MKDNFAQNLKRIRQQKTISHTMTQTDLAQATGLKPSAISHFEGGRRKPSMKNLILLANTLEVSIDDLIGGNFHD